MCFKNKTLKLNRNCIKIFRFLKKFFENYFGEIEISMSEFYKYDININTVISIIIHFHYHMFKNSF